MCDCDLYKKIKEVFPHVMEGDYDNYYDTHMVSENGSFNIGKWASKNIHTRMFSQNMENIKMICPKHHPFFRYLIQKKLNLDFSLYSECIYHAWYHIPSNDLKLLWDNEEDFSIFQNRIKFGLKKAWKMFMKDRNANVKTYYYDCGGTCTDSDDEYDSL